jgi:hypothetical protein
VAAGRCAPISLKQSWEEGLGFAQWFASPRLAWFTIIVFASAVLYAFSWPIRVERIVRAGVLLQLVGTCMGFWALRATRLLFKMPSLMAEVRAWIARRPRKLTIQLTAGGVSFSGGNVKLSAWHAMGSDIDAATRLNAVVANIEQLRKEAGESNTEHTAALTKLRADMDAKTRNIEEGLSGTTRALHESQTGGLWAAWVALLMLFVGTVLASSPIWAGALPMPTITLAKAVTESPTIPDIHTLPLIAPDRRGTEQQPLVISRAPEELQRDEIEQTDRARDEYVMTVATVALAILTLLLWVVNMVLLRDARRVSAQQARDTARAIEEAKRSADAMHDVARVTKENAVMMSGMFAKQMRAYLSVEFGTAIYQDKNHRFEAMPMLANTGLTPARNVCFKALAAIHDGTQPNEPSFASIGDLVVNDVGIAPRQSFTIRAMLPDRVPDADVASIMQGNTRRLFAWGKVTYDDVYGGSWETNFCISYWFARVGEDVKVFGNFYPKHNNAT